MIRERLKEKPLVSVIVPVYNAQDTLKRCVDSILHQTYDLLEIILVDDGATDASGRMCDAYAEEDGRVTVLHKNNGGLMSAWMAGVDIAKGEYLCLVDSDDWAEKEMIEHLAERRSEAYGDAEIICCNHVIDHTNGNIQKMRHGASPGEYTDRKLQEEIFRKILGNQNRTVSMSRCMKLTSTKLIRDNVHYCDPSIKMGEDVNIMLPAILDSKRIVILKDTYDYHYRYNDASIVHRYDAGLGQNNRKLVDKIGEVLQDKFRGEALSSMNVKDAEIEAMKQKERLLFFMLELKNEFRNPASNVVKRIKALCNEEMIPLLAQKYPLEIIGAADKLLYAIEKNPTAMRICAAKTLYGLRHRA